MLPRFLAVVRKSSHFNDCLGIS